MEVVIGNSQDPLWKTCLQRQAYDFYAMPKYVDLCAAQEGGESFFVYAQDGSNSLFIPLIKRPIEGYFDAVSPYGYPGFLLEAETKSFALRACDAIKQVLAENQFVSMFLRLHPILNQNVLPMQKLGHLVSQGHTVLIDLKLSETELWRQTCSSNRNQINHALKIGHLTIIDQSLNDLDSFVSMYYDTMNRLDASKFYFFDKDYFIKLKEILGKRLFLASVKIGQDIAAAALFTEINGIVQYHLSASTEQFRRERPTKTLLHQVRSWAKQRGNRWMHLGGGLAGQNDSLFEFKAGFSKLRQPFYTLRSIIQPQIYHDLVRKHQPALDPDNLTGYFPLYRA
jgi:hypothetical protein